MTSNIPAGNTEASAEARASRVELARFKPFYLGLFLSMLLLALLPLVAATMCRPEKPLPCPLGLLASLAAALTAAMLHEALHYLAARILHVQGLRLRLHRGLAALMVEYDWMTPRQYLVVALAPQLLTLLLAAAIAATSGALRLLLCVAAAANLAGGAPDIVNALYFYMVHGSALRFTLLYGEDGSVAGGVVEYRDGRLVVYVF